MVLWAASRVGLAQNSTQNCGMAPPLELEQKIRAEKRTESE